MRFEFATATRILFGPGTLQDVGPLAAEMGKRAFVLTGSSTERASPLLKQLAKHKIESVTFQVPSEPTVTLAQEAAAKARQASSDMVIAIGGGSPIDVGKVVAALITNSGELNEYLEVVGDAKPLKIPSAPYIAIPTTAGTGAEVTKNAVLAVPEHKVKVSMRSPLLLPRMAIVDPVLTHLLPPALTASTGLDALTQLIEAYVSNKANPLTDAICRDGLVRVARSLLRAYENGGDANAREDMSLASLFSGLALANAGLGAVHGLAAALGATIPASHGVICGRLLPFVLEANIRALKTRQCDSPVLTRFDEIAHLLTGIPAARAANAVRWTYRLCSDLNIQPLGDFRLMEQDISVVAAKAVKSSSMKGNPIELQEEELIKILKNAASKDI